MNLSYIAAHPSFASSIECPKCTSPTVLFEDIQVPTMTRLGIAWATLKKPTVH